MPFLPAFLLAACAAPAPGDTARTAATPSTATAPGGAADGVVPDTRVEGPHAVRAEDGSTALASCTMAWTRYVPEGVEPEGRVVLAHGFLRSRAQLDGYGQRMASWGLEVVAVDLCHASLLDTDHEQNGLDLAELAATLPPLPTVYGGHSAGGLAAWVAGATDPGADGVLGLDPVDDGGLAAEVAGGLAAPFGGLFGEPSDCNAQGNGRALVDLSGGTGFAVTEADHCDFEQPTDSLCTLVCPGTNERFDDAAIAEAVLALATAFALEATGVDPDAAAWWTEGGEPLDELLAEGRLSALEDRR